jgi:hypothetical protein
MPLYIRPSSSSFDPKTSIKHVVSLSNFIAAARLGAIGLAPTSLVVFRCQRSSASCLCCATATPSFQSQDFATEVIQG